MVQNIHSMTLESGSFMHKLQKFPFLFFFIKSLNIYLLFNITINDNDSDKVILDISY